jgi:hypothetical protein
MRHENLLAMDARAALTRCALVGKTNLRTRRKSTQEVFEFCTPLSLQQEARILVDCVCRPRITIREIRDAEAHFDGVVLAMG